MSNDININRLYDQFEHVQTRPIFGRGPNGERKRIADVSYITARQVMDRLDEVFGVLNWWTRFTVIGENTVLCELTVSLPGGTTVTKSDFGYSNNNNDSDNGIKGAASDALKRAAVHFGIGRYLYGESEDQSSQNDYQNRRPQAYTVPRLPRAHADAGTRQGRQAAAQRTDHYDRQVKPFGSEDDVQQMPSQSNIARLNALRARHRWTDAQFREAFGVNYSNEVVEQMIADGMTPEEINDTVLAGG